MALSSSSERGWPRRHRVVDYASDRGKLRFRKELGDHATQQYVADLAGVSVFSISRYEGGYGRPNISALMKLAKVYGRQVDDFFSTNPPPPRTPQRVVAFKIVGELDDDLRSKIQKAMDEISDEQAARVAKLKKEMRRGKKL